jgi:hypothetical protein
MLSSGFAAKDAADFAALNKPIQLVGGSKASPDDLAAKALMATK